MADFLLLLLKALQLPIPFFSLGLVGGGLHLLQKPGLPGGDLRLLGLQILGGSLQGLEPLQGLLAPLGVGIAGGDVPVINEGAVEEVFILIKKGDAVIFLGVFLVDFLAEPGGLIRDTGIGVMLEKTVDFLRRPVNHLLVPGCSDGLKVG